MILNSKKNTDNSGIFNEKLEKSERINVNFNVDILENIDKGQEEGNQNNLPNSVRLSIPSFVTSDREELWGDFRKYLINEGQRKHSVRNKEVMRNDIARYLKLKMLECY